jgi:hypothetical protein
MMLHLFALIPAVLTALINWKPTAFLLSTLGGAEAFIPSQLHSILPKSLASPTSLNANSIWTDSQKPWEDTIAELIPPVTKPTQQRNQLDFQFKPPWSSNRHSIPFVRADDTTLLATWMMRNEEYLKLSIVIDGIDKTLLEYYLQGVEEGSRVEMGGWYEEVFESGMSDVVMAILFEVDVMADLMLASNFKKKKKILGIPEEWMAMSDKDVSKVHVAASALKSS